MAKKQKSKARLDKYYYLAKEHGFRSRAAFKLIQLNKKYNFLGNANCLIDLCAAPGGWLQVAAKYMPVSSIKIGVDLDPIKPIHGVTHFQADITSEKCRFLIKKEIKHFKADVVLNDGAPNVGGQWSKDAYNQSELVLYALKLATEFLKEDGIFVTKVFRSSDYNSLLYVLKQLFKRVEATKPQASRNESAEIFVVCMGYKAPQYIDSKLLDPKYALTQLEDEEDMKMNSIKSIKAMFEKTKHRSGYSGKLYNEKSFKEFIESQNPYQFLVEANKIKLLTDDCRRYLETMKCPMDYKLYFEDLQTLGKKEIQELIIWRNKIRAKTQKKDKADKADKAAEGGEAEGVKEIELNYKEKKLEEIDEELNEFEKARKKRLENEKKKREKNDLRMKMSFVNQQESGPQVDEIEFDQNLFEFIKNNEINIEELDYKDTDKLMMIPQQTVEEVDLSDLSEDDFIDMMDEDIQENRRLFKENKSENHKKKEKREKKKKFERENEDEEEKKKKLGDGIDYVKNEDKDSDMEIDNEENEDEESQENDSVLGSDEDSENSEFEEDSDEAFVKNQIKKGSKAKKSFEEDQEEIESESENENGDSDQDEEEELMEIDNEELKEDKNDKSKVENKIKEKKDAKEKTEDLFENPLRRKKNAEKMNKTKFNENADNKQNKQADKTKEQIDSENNISSDTDDEANSKLKKKSKQLKSQQSELKLLGKKTLRTETSSAASKIETNSNTNLSETNNSANTKIDLVPQDSDSSQEDSEYDSDEKAEIRAIAKKMLRKKDRLDILYKTYNRYAFDDTEEAPEWFREEEIKHNRPKMPVSKEEILKQKEALRAFNARIPKKILEAKARKKNKLTKRLDRVKQKAQAISNQDDINEFSKVKQIEKLYRKEINKTKEKKKYVVARSNRQNMGKSGRNVKFVDRRLKKDTKALKRAEKRNKKKGVSKPKGKGKKAGRR